MGSWYRMLKAKLKEILKREIKSNELMLEYKKHNGVILYSMIQNEIEVAEFLVFAIGKNIVINNIMISDSKIEILIYNIKYEDCNNIILYKSTEGDE